MKRTTVALLGYHDQNIEPIKQIVDSKIFQRLRYIKQLGTSSLVFISANHTRFEHSLGTYALMLERGRNWLRDGMITEDEAHNLYLYSLLHDIGHGPYSHVTEIFCAQDHNAYGLFLAEQLSDEIQACGGDMDVIKSLLRRDNPLAQAVFHRPLGVDKLDYVKRDSFYTTSTSGFRTGDMLNHVHYINGSLAVEKKIMSEVMQLQTDYVNMLDRVYFRQGCLIAQYFLQQTVARAIKSGDVLRDELPGMTDSRLDAALMNAKDPIVRRMFERLLFRDLPKTAVLLRAEETLIPDNTEAKEIAVFRIPLARLEEFSFLDRREIAAEHETAIAKIAGLPPEAVLLTPVASPHRFILDEVPVLDIGHTENTLSDFYPRHFEKLREIAVGYAAVRVCVSAQYRQSVSDSRKSLSIVRYLMDLI